MVDDGGRSSSKLKAFRAEASTVELYSSSEDFIKKTKEGFSSGVAAGNPSDPRTSILCASVQPRNNHNKPESNCRFSVIQALIRKQDGRSTQCGSS
jgi:hypothetical protein